MAKTVKKTVRKKKRERKNIEKGQAHIQSTHFHGPAQVPWVSRVPRNPHRLRLRWLLKKQAKAQLNTD